MPKSLRPEKRLSSARGNCSKILCNFMRPTDNTKTGLVRAAARARLCAVAPYSKFKVGAALLSRSGDIIVGANVESASYGLTCCAERVALFNALTSGKRNFTAIAIVARLDGGPMPCGACRQLLAEYAPDAVVFVADSRDVKAVKTFAVRDLLPHAFRDFRTD